MSMFGVPQKEQYNSLFETLNQPADTTALAREQAPGFLAGDLGEAAGSGVYRGLSRGAATLGNVATPALRPIAKSIDELFGTSTDDWLLGEQEKANRALVDSKLDPRTTGMAGQLLHGLGDVLTTVVSTGGNPYAAGGLYGITQTQLGMAEGLDTTTALAKGTIEGLGLGIGVGLAPAYGTTLTQKLLSGAGINVGIGVGTRAPISVLLNSRGYPEMAQQYAPLDATSLITDAVLGAAFGGIYRKPAAAKPIPAEAVAPSTVDAALTANQTHHAEIDTAPGVPSDTRTRQQHAAALETAVEQLAMGKEVSVERILQDAGFLGKRPDFDALRVITEELEKAGATDVVAKLRDIEAEAKARGLYVEPDSLGSVVRSETPVETTVAGTAVRESQVRIGDDYVPTRLMLVEAGDVAATMGKAENQFRDRTRMASEQFGEAVDSMQAPMLVRVLQRDVDVAKAAILSNEGQALRMSALEQAKVDAERLGDFRAFEFSEDGAVDLAGNMPFIRAWVEQMPLGQRAAIMDADGKLSAEGAKRLQNAILYRAYGDSPTLARLVEATDPGSRNIAAALTRAAPAVADAREAIARGDLYPMGLHDDLIGAVEKLEALRKAGQSVTDWVKQIDAFGDGLTAEARVLVQFLDANIRATRQISEGIFGFYNRLMEAGNPKQGSMFEAAQPDKMRMLTLALEQPAPMYSRSLADYFAEQGIAAPRARLEQVEAYRSEAAWTERTTDAATGLPVWANRDVRLDGPRDVTEAHDAFYMPQGGERAIKYDIRGANGENVGYTVLEMDGDWPVRLLDIDINESLRGQRHGEKAIAAITADVGELGIWHIIPSSRSWWERVGVRATDEHHGVLGFTDYADARAARENPSRVAGGVNGRGYSRGAGENVGETADELRTVFRAQFGRDADRLLDAGRVEIVQSVRDLPGAGHPSDVGGMYWQGKAWIVADNTGLSQVRGRVLHEIGEHAGMEQMLGAGFYQKVLETVARKAETDPVFAEARGLAEQRANKPEHVPAETLAYLIENAPELPMVRRILAQVRQWLYRTTGGRFVDLTQADLQMMAVASLRRYARAAEVEARGGDAPWYMTFFHGTPNPFRPEEDAPLGRLRWKYINTGEGAQAFGYGHYVAQQEWIARTRYRDRLVKRNAGNASMEIDGPNGKVTITGDDAPAYRIGDRLVHEKMDGEGAGYAWTIRELMSGSTVDQVRQWAEQDLEGYRSQLEMADRGFRVVQVDGGWNIENPAGKMEYRSALPDEAEVKIAAEHLNGGFRRSGSLGSDEQIASLRNLVAQAEASLRAVDEVTIEVIGEDSRILDPDITEVRPEPPKGALYGKHIPDEEYARMMIWDAPLDKQPESVRAAFEKVGIVAPKRPEIPPLDELLKRYGYKIDKAPAGSPAAYRLTFKDGSSVFYDSLGDAELAVFREWKADTGFDDFKDMTGAQAYYKLRDMIVGADDSIGEAWYAAEQEIMARREFAEVDDFMEYRDEVANMDSYVEEVASVILWQAGVPGHRFLDGETRAAGWDSPDAKFNLVLYSDDLGRVAWEAKDGDAEWVTANGKGRITTGDNPNGPGLEYFAEVDGQIIGSAFTIEEAARMVEREMDSFYSRTGGDTIQATDPVEDTTMPGARLLAAQADAEIAQATELSQGMMPAVECFLQVGQ